MARQQVSYESRVEECKKKIREKPEAALREIGKFLVKEIRKGTPKSVEAHTHNVDGRPVKVKSGMLRKSVGYWFRKKQNDLQVGFKAFYAPFVILGTKLRGGDDFFTRIVMNHVKDIQDMIKEALKELEKEK